MPTLRIHKQSGVELFFFRMKTGQTDASSLHNRIFTTGPLRCSPKNMIDSRGVALPEVSCS